MKNLHHLILSSAFLVICGSFANAQVYTPPTQGNTPAQGGSGGGGNNTTVTNQPAQQNNQPVVGNEVPFFDMRTNTVDFNGKTFNVKQNDIFRARFEKYLNTAEATDANTKAYQSTIDEVIKILGPTSQTKEKLSAAIARMQFAATFDQDARLCDSIINAVYRLVLTKKNSHELKRLNQQLDEERRRLDWNFKTVSDPSAFQRTSDGKGGTSTAPSAGQASEQLRLTTRIAEKEKERIANIAKINISEAKARIDFQALMVQLFLQRRFEHVIMSTRLYTEFYRDGSAELDFEKGSELEKTFTESIGFSPTINTLDAFSNEAIRDVKQQVESFMFLADKKEIDSASKQLQQAFVTGEHLPVVQNVPREYRRKIQTYARNAFKLTNAFEAKDYTLAGSLLEEMRKEATDFDYAKASAGIETAKLMSNMKLRAAKNAFLQDDTEKFEKLLAEATGIWPLNPAIKTEFNNISDSGDTIMQTRKDFDKLLNQKNYREIFDNKERFMVATHNDPERAAALKQISENMLEIKIALEQAKKLDNVGNKFAAWELISEKFDKYPDDVPLSAKLSEMTPGVAEFAHALSEAERLRENGQNGSSLAWFLAARKIFPLSSKAKSGIADLVDVILPEN